MVSEKAVIGAGLMITKSESVERLHSAVRARIPFSLIRLGDGEGMLLGHRHRDLYKEDDAKEICKVFFGEPLDDESIDAINDDLVRAICNADLVGIPPPNSPKYRYANVSKLVNRIARDSTLSTSGIHRYLLDSGALENILTSVPFLGVITCRDVSGFLKSKYDIGEVRQYWIPEEFKFAIEPPGINHYPDRFLELTELVKVPFRGAVFFVGAGALGKVYCDIIKRKGGIAVDIGSIFDLWAGRSTRAYMDSETLNNNRLAMNRSVAELDALLIEAIKKDSPEDFMEISRLFDDKRCRGVALSVMLAGSKMFDRSAAVHHGVSFAYTRCGMIDMALKHSSIAIDLNPNNEALHRFHSRLVSLSGEQTSSSNL